jgi:L,D-transpeptidase-like protein
VKILLGDSYLIHQADKNSDIGRLVSHGCIRMRKADLLELSDLIMEARGWPISKSRIEEAKKSKRRVALKFTPPIPVKIDYETIVIDNGRLYVYSDIYKRGTNSVHRLREKLQEAGSDTSKWSNKILNNIVAKVRRGGSYSSSLANVVNK